MLKEFSFHEMNEVKGGISVEEYCAKLGWLMVNYWPDWLSMWKTAGLMRMLPIVLVDMDALIFKTIKTPD